jgi:transcriptional regulator with PAS, ATPase and Fis domain
VLNLSPLREQPERIRELCLQFENKNFCVLSEDLIKFYENCSWPGNIRQLLSHLTKKRILSAGKKIVIDKSDYDLQEERPDTSMLENHQLKTLEQVKMDYCLNVYNKVEKNMSKASKLLEISPNTLKAMLGNIEKSKILKLRNNEIVDIDL